MLVFLERGRWIMHYMRWIMHYIMSVLAVGFVAAMLLGLV